jgi:membrane protein DedA with SNARE-associated domain
MDWVAALLEALEGLPPGLTYAVLGLGAAVENVFPPVPADTFVVLGSFLAARGEASLQTVFFVTWIANVASASAVYVAGRRYGADFFRHGFGRRLLNPVQVERLRGFYDRWGVWAILLTRFLPGLRAVVPVFAGVTQQTAPRVVFPIVVASAIWHAALVIAGGIAGRNLEAILRTLAGVNRTLVVVAVVVAVPAMIWWVMTRKHEGHDG